MKKHAKFYLLSLCLWATTLLLAACASTDVIDKPSNKISIISISSHSGMVAPTYRTSSQLTLEADLNLTYLVKDYRRAIKTQKNIKMTQAQFDDVIKSIENIDISKLKPKIHPSTVGGGSGSVSLDTGKENYNFYTNGGTDYPAEIAQLVSKANKLVTE